MAGQTLIQVAALLILLALTASVWLLWRETKSHRIWSRKRFAQEYLNTFVTGEFPILREKFEKIQECQVWNLEDSYAHKCKTFSQDRIDTIDPMLKKILNIFEGMCINIEVDVLDEDICYNYLGWLLVAYHRWSLEYIRSLRDRAGDDRLYFHLERYANNWGERIESEGIR
jgi:hypothetical protein